MQDEDSYKVPYEYGMLRQQRPAADGLNNTQTLGNGGSVSEKRGGTSTEEIMGEKRESNMKNKLKK